MDYLKQYRWLVGIAVAGALLALAQHWNTRDVERRTAELHALMSDTQAGALQLTRRIGYGGLIHHFKNFVLRPSEQQNYTDAVADARAAAVSIDALESNAARLGLQSTLENTRAMVDTYLSRLDRVQKLYQEGKGAVAIDTVVRFNDTFAIREVDTLLAELSQAVSLRIDQISRDASILNGIGLGGIVILGSLVLILLVNQHHRRRQVNTIQQLNESLRSSNGDLEAFAYIASHDLKSPLRRILTLVEFIQEDLADCADKSTLPEDLEENLQRIGTQAERAQHLVSDIFDYSKIGKVTEQLVLVDSEALVDAIGENLSLPATARLTSENLPVLHTYSIRLDQVLGNLIGNAFKYHHDIESAVVNVRAARQGDFYHFCVTDNGPGIEPRFHERIFKAFETLQSSDEVDGTGVGLSIVKKNVELVGGTIQVSSEYGVSTTFHFTWPVEIGDDMRREPLANAA